MSAYQVFWGDTHNNVYTGPEDKPHTPSLQEVCQYAATYMDFYAPAYYTPVMVHHALAPELNQDGKYAGVRTESWKPEARLTREWADVQAITAAANAPGSFVTFPCYEWQGDGTWGDHNVVYKAEGQPLFSVGTVPELYEKLRGLDAIAIPHHTAYNRDHRSKNWDAFDEKISPFAEIFSCHGGSESDEEWVPLRRNGHMGPGVGGCTYEDGLNRGLHVGAICSTDSWGFMPAWYGRGLMGCWAEELTRDSLWEAFLARRVYGVTGDRIELEFMVNGTPMGSVMPGASKRCIEVKVRGCDALDRIEILRNNRVIATHCHQGTWDRPGSGETSCFKLRVEAGWGPYPHDIPLPDTDWQGRLSVADGTLKGWEPCWLDYGQTAAACDESGASFGFRSKQYEGHFNADIFEVQGTPASRVRLELNGMTVEATLAELCASSRLLWFREESEAHVAKLTGVKPEDCDRLDTFFHMGRKAKLHRAIPEAGYTATFAMEDDEPLTEETHYRVRVEQRNGQRAWSSPVWVQPA